ncbi:MAG TPA: S8 family serine peptidase [Frankiaceae bacterium]|nr:S8 family serine peptidase [Frankiaceae bacterium]
MENQALSAYPKALLRDVIGADGTADSPQIVTYCRANACAHYNWLAGTSMASPHAAGVAALIVSKFGKPDPAHPGGLTMDPAGVERRLVETAVPLSCPNPRTHTYPNGGSATCRQSGDRTSFYGAGLVDAQAAVAD